MGQKYLNVILSEDDWIHEYENQKPWVHLNGYDRDSYPYILTKGDVVYEEEAFEAMDILARYLYQNKCTKVVYNFEGRNKKLAPAKEMTVAEIEKALGHKVKIVK